MLSSLNGCIAYVCVCCCRMVPGISSEALCAGCNSVASLWPLAMVLPVRKAYSRVLSGARDVKKDRRPFSVPRQLGLGWEQFYRFFYDNGYLRLHDVDSVKLRNGLLQQRSGRTWKEVSGVDVLLSTGHQQFLTDRVHQDHEALTALGFWVKKVDPHKGVADRSCDVWGAFTSRGTADVQGNVGVERKFAFGSAGFTKAISENKSVLTKSLKNPGLAGHMLWVTQLSGKEEVVAVNEKVLFKPRSGQWRVLVAPTGCVRHQGDTGFSGAWERCRKLKKDKSRLDVVLVAHFLKEMGSSSTRVKERITVWTGKHSKLGLAKGTHFWKQRVPGSSTGTKVQWVASKATLRKVWELSRS